MDLSVADVLLEDSTLDKTITELKELIILIENFEKSDFVRLVKRYGQAEAVKKISEKYQDIPLKFQNVQNLSLQLTEEMKNENKKDEDYDPEKLKRYAELSMKVMQFYLKNMEHFEKGKKLNRAARRAAKK